MQNQAFKIMASPSKNPKQKTESDEETTAHQPSGYDSIQNPFLSDRKEPKKEESDNKNESDSCRNSGENCVRRREIEDSGAISAPREEMIGTGSGRERLKRHRVEVAGRIWIPDTWGKEELLKDWIDCAAFDASLVGSSIISARAALMEEGKRTSSCTRLRVENGC